VTPDHAAAIVERQRLDLAFESVTVDQRVCVALHYSLDVPVRQIAETLGVPEGTVKSRIHAGITRMRAALEVDDR
jgi:RNA polymerase sigma-70 factor (ECF subfamily)